MKTLEILPADQLPTNALLTALVLFVLAWAVVWVIAKVVEKVTGEKL